MLLFFAISFVLATLATTSTSSSSDSEANAVFRSRSLFDPIHTRIPDHLLECYTDRKLWDRFARLPASMDSLVAIIRKVELHPKVSHWTPGRLASRLLHTFRLDGIEYDRCVDTSNGAVPFRLDLQTEYPKMALIWQLVSGGDADDFPDDALTPEETCSLHWMLSYSVNTTFRVEEVFWSTDYENKGSWDRKKIRLPWSRNDQQRASQGQHRDCRDKTPESHAPWEMGVVWSPTGPVSAGTVLAGLAAGLQPQRVNWAAGQVDNAWAATLAGDLAQTALMKGRDDPYIGPDGYFNSTICPMEFYLRTSDGGSSSSGSGFAKSSHFSHLTVSEINGGLDGLILAELSSKWQQRSEMGLSQMLDLYYSNGVPSGRSGGKTESACRRYDNYEDMVPGYKLTEEAFVFGTELKHLLVYTMDDSALRSAISQAKTQLDREIDLLASSLREFGPCVEQRRRDGKYSRSSAGSGSNTKYSDEAMSYSSDGPADVGIILDTSVYKWEEEMYQKQVAAAVVNNLEIWLTKIKQGRDQVFVNGGSFVEVSDGRYGNVLISSGSGSGSDSGSSSSNNTNYPTWFSNKADLACNVYRNRIPSLGPLNPSNSMEVVASRMASRAAERKRRGLNGGKAQVIVLIMFGRLSDDDSIDFYDAVFSLRRHFPDVRLVIATRWAPAQVFHKYVLSPQHDILALNQLNGEWRAEEDGRRIARRIKQLPGQLTYSDCGDKDDIFYLELDSEEILEVLPKSQRFLQVPAQFIHRSEMLKMIFRVKYNSVEICWSRSPPEDQSEELGNDQCRFAGAGKGSSGSVVKVDFPDPCQGQSLTRCSPIYFRLRGVDSGGRGCRTESGFPCRSAMAAEILITHEGMTCDASAVFFSMVSLGISMVLSLFVLR